MDLNLLLAAGIHELQLTVEDECGNLDSTRVFVVETARAPVILILMVSLTCKTMVRHSIVFLVDAEQCGELPKHRF